MRDRIKSAPLLFYLDALQRHIRDLLSTGHGCFLTTTPAREAELWLDFMRECYALESGL